MAIFTIIGGGGKVALKFTKLSTDAGHTVHSVVRNDGHDAEIKSAGGKPILWSLEDDSVADLSHHLTKTQTEAVIFAAGAGGGDPARTRKVDYEGALKVADAVEQAGLKRLLMISAADLRDRSQPPPEHYNDADIALSDRMWKAIPDYMKAKYEADLNLLDRAARKTLSPLILRPGGLTDDAPTHAVQLGSPHLGRVARSDVAGVALRLLENPKAPVGLVVDLMGPSEEEKGESWEAAVDRVCKDRTVV